MTNTAQEPVQSNLEHPHPDIDNTINIIMNIEAPKHAAAKYAFINALPLRMI